MRRGQLVLVAAALVAVALAPIVLSYLQLGYHGDVRATADHGDQTRDARRTLDRAVATAQSGVTGEYAWSRRRAAVTEVRGRLEPRLERLRTSEVDAGTVHAATYNGTVAGAWADERCPGGPARQFGACAVDRGVLVQNRTGVTHVVGVGFDLTTTTPRGETRVTVFVRPVGR
ncbi:MULTISPECIES: DUF7261 family protein [Haloarcula]|uniref:DUF7261 family protein n=1 Tax=Haloarcula TaxID=2237 RepID=UPI0023ECA57A|nr:hypothetical protein [Halomicroarcula sp. XH51]